VPGRRASGVAALAEPVRLRYKGALLVATDALRKGRLTEFRLGLELHVSSEDTKLCATADVTGKLEAF
jgi:hypothetical protein